MERMAAAWKHRGNLLERKVGGGWRNGFAKEWCGQERKGLECPASYFEFYFTNSGETL